MNLGKAPDSLLLYCSGLWSPISWARPSKCSFNMESNLDANRNIHVMPHFPVIHSIVWQLWHFGPVPCHNLSNCTTRHHWLGSHECACVLWTQWGLENFSFCLRCHSLVIWPLVNHLTRPTFSFLMGKIKVCTTGSLKSLQARKCHEFMNTINSRLPLS